MPARPSLRERLAALSRTVLQVLAILGLAGILLMIAHKGYTDVTRLAQSHGRGDFWPALLRYLFRNLAGG